MQTNEKKVFSEECSTTAYQEHRVYSVGYYFKHEYDDSLSFYSSSGNNVNCLDWFIKQLKHIACYVESSLNHNTPMEPLTAEQERALKDPETKCFICGGRFEVDEARCKDHNHFNGQLRGICHASCNLNYQESREIPIVMHNLSGYDVHMFIKKLATGMKGDLSIIPVNSEHYISITKTVWESAYAYKRVVKKKIKLKFIDSFRFMAESLSKLASLIPSEKKHILHSVCSKNYTKEQITMLERKGVFPYDYVDSYERLAETSLPSKEHFYNQLNDEEISDEDYQFACSVWEKFELKTLGEYSELYLKTDVLLLADVFENFRNICYSIYNLDVMRFYTAAGLSYAAMLKYTKVEIELLTDVEMLLFIENSVRGGLAQCSIRHVKANNKYMKDDYKPEKKSNYLMYLDGMFICI